MLMLAHGSKQVNSSGCQPMTFRLVGTTFEIGLMHLKQLVCILHSCFQLLKEKKTFLGVIHFDFTTFYIHSILS